MKQEKIYIAPNPGEEETIDQVITPEIPGRLKLEKGETSQQLVEAGYVPLDKILEIVNPGKITLEKLKFYNLIGKRIEGGCWSYVFSCVVEVLFGYESERENALTVEGMTPSDGKGFTNGEKLYSTPLLEILDPSEVYVRRVNINMNSPDQREFCDYLGDWYLVTERGWREIKTKME